MLFVLHTAGTGFCPGQQAGIRLRAPRYGVTSPPGLVSWGQNSPEANVVVGVVRGVVVAIANPAVVGVVVPTAAAIHAVRALWAEPPKDLRFQIDDCRLSSRRCLCGKACLVDDSPSQPEAVREPHVREQCFHVPGQVSL